MKDLNELIRANVLKMKPYSSARNEYKGEATVFLDANENPFDLAYNRYPDPLQWAVKKELAKLKGVREEQIFLGNGSDEPIDLLIRAFCDPGKDAITSITPSYGMYEVSAEVNDVEFRKVPLTAGFELDAAEVIRVAGNDSKLIYLCSPNNPTGNDLSRAEMLKIVEGFDGLVIVDEAYIDFSAAPSCLTFLSRYPNLVVLQTFSKAWGAAAMRLGMAFASPEIIAVLNKIKYPYNINQLTQEYALKLLSQEKEMKEQLARILDGRALLEREMRELPCVKKIYPSDANFILARFVDANYIYNRLVEKGIIVRNRTNILLCEGCLRITVGTEEENRILLDELKAIDL